MSYSRISLAHLTPGRINADFLVLILFTFSHAPFIAFFSSTHEAIASINWIILLGTRYFIKIICFNFYDTSTIYTHIKNR